MAPLAIPLLIGGIGLQVAGQLQAGRAAEAQAESEQNLANYNAQVAEQEAKARRQRAAFAQKRQVKRGAEIKGALTAKLGVGLGSPVAADLAAEQAAEIELETLMIGFEGEVLTRRAETQAELDRLQGRLAKQRGKARARMANIQFGTQVATLGLTAGGSFLTGFGGRGSRTVGAGGLL